MPYFRVYNQSPNFARSSYETPLPYFWLPTEYFMLKILTLSEKNFNGFGEEKGVKFFKLTFEALSWHKSTAIREKWRHPTHMFRKCITWFQSPFLLVR